MRGEAARVNGAETFRAARPQRDRPEAVYYSARAGAQRCPRAHRTNPVCHDAPPRQAGTKARRIGPAALN